MRIVRETRVAESGGIDIQTAIHMIKKAVQGHVPVVAVSTHGALADVHLTGKLKLGFGDKGRLEIKTPMGPILISLNARVARLEEGGKGEVPDEVLVLTYHDASILYLTTEGDGWGRASVMED